MLVLSAWVWIRTPSTCKNAWKLEQPSGSLPVLCLSTNMHSTYKNRTKTFSGKWKIPQITHLYLLLELSTQDLLPLPRTDVIIQIGHHQFDDVVAIHLIHWGASQICHWQHWWGCPTHRLECIPCKILHHPIAQAQAAAEASGWPWSTSTAHATCTRCWALGSRCSPKVGTVPWCFKWRQYLWWLESPWQWSHVRITCITAVLLPASVWTATVLPALVCVDLLLCESHWSCWRSEALGNLPET